MIDANDRQILGTEYPAWTFGANLSFGYKGINISADFQGIADAYTYGTCEYYTPTFQGSNFGQYWTKRWTPEHPSETVPRLWVESGPNVDYANSYFLMDRTYLRLKNLVLSYDLAVKHHPYAEDGENESICFRFQFIHLDEEGLPGTGSGTLQRCR